MITFKGLKSLQFLELNVNKLVYLDVTTFRTLVELYTLDLSQNLLENLEPFTFLSLRSSLDLLLLRENKLKSFSVTDLFCLKVDKLDLCENKELEVAGLVDASSCGNFSTLRQNWEMSNKVNYNDCLENSTATAISSTKKSAETTESTSTETGTEKMTEPTTKLITDKKLFTTTTTTTTTTPTTTKRPTITTTAKTMTTTYHLTTLKIFTSNRLPISRQAKTTTFKPIIFWTFTKLTKTTKTLSNSSLARQNVSSEILVNEADSHFSEKEVFRKQYFYLFLIYLIL